MNKELVKFIRNLHGMTQNEFGDYLGYSRCYVMMIECGYRDLSKNYEEKIIKKFNLSLDDITHLNEMAKTLRKEKQFN